MDQNVSELTNNCVHVHCTFYMYSLHQTERILVFQSVIRVDLVLTSGGLEVMLVLTLGGCSPPCFVMSKIFPETKDNLYAIIRTCVIMVNTVVIIIIIFETCTCIYKSIGIPLFFLHPFFPTCCSCLFCCLLLIIFPSRHLFLPLG